MDRSAMQKYVKSVVEVSTLIMSNIAHYWNRCC